MNVGTEGTAAVTGTPPAAQVTTETFSGVWLSRYEFHSSSRDTTYACKHYVVIVQHGTGSPLGACRARAATPTARSRWT